MQPRILITGPSGVGKTTLAKWVSEEYQIPFVSVSIIRDICKYNDITNHQQIIDLSSTNPELHDLMQWELWVTRINKFMEHQLSGFVTDRGHVDSLVYMSMQGKPSSLPRFINGSKLVRNLFSHIIFIPMTPGWEVKDDKKRIANKEYQLRVSRVYVDILNMLEVPYFTLVNPDFEIRKLFVENYINQD